MNSRRYNVFAWLGVLLLLAVSTPAVMVSRTIMFYDPEAVFGSSLVSMNIRDANGTMLPPTASSPYWSYTFTKDSNQYNFEFNQGNYEVFFQVKAGGNENQCYDINGWRKTDQNCTGKFMNMGKWPNDTMWIVPDMFDSKFKPDTFFTKPVFWTFYFVPPDDPDWFQGRAQMIVDGAAPVYMNTDPDYCGVYRQVYYPGKAGKSPPTNLTFVLDVDNTWQVGYNGISEDVPTAINLQEEFAKRGDGDINLIFDADGGTEGWTTDMFTGPPRQCGYNLAAIIYDTDASLHGAFTCVPDWFQGYDGKKNACRYESAPYNFASVTPTPCLGVTPGVVSSDLGADNKPVYNPSSNCFESKEAFDVMFKPTPKVNESYCVDMPFTRAKDGKWEFDSDNYTSPGATVKGGFYPGETTPVNMLSDRLPAAENKRKAEGPVFLCNGLREIDASEGVPKIDVFCNGPGWDGGIDCAGLFKEGTELDKAKLLPAGTTGDGWGWSCPDEAPDGWTKYKANSETVSTANDAVTRWVSGPEKGGDGSVLKDEGRNQHFCFESHAEFVYRPGQRFSFRGDDDIWVYINKKLAVDLGGTHLAAPGYVNLNELGLVEGTTYPIDIFFCDRRTTMSNVRIKTNMFFSQKNGLFTQEVENDTAALEICKMSGSTSNCDALLSGNSSEVICGDKLASELRYFLTSRRAGDTLWLADTNKNCSYADGVLTCYGGVKIGAGKVSVDKSKIKGLAGTYIVWAQLTDPTNPLKVRIAKFTTKTDVAVITTQADINGTVKDLAPPSQVVAGKLVPVYFASGDLNNGIFLIDTEGGVGKSFQINNAAGALGDASSLASLQIYRDSLGTVEAKASELFTIGAGGLCTLWVKGNYQATANYTYSINVSLARTAALSLQVMQPTLQFRDETYASPVAASGPWQNGSIPYMGEVTNRYLVALDPVSGGICSTCSFALSSVSEETSGTFANPVGISTMGMVAGKAVVGITGNEVVVDPNFASVTVRGLSPLTAATWDSLRFKEPPVPVPVLVNLFDKNGDGKGDSLVIHYHRAIPSADSLADKLSIVWPAGTTDTLVIPKSELSSYWKQGYPDSMLVIADRDFSEEILTAGNGSLINTATFKDPETNLENTVAFSRAISDKMGPVIVRASYSAPKSSCGSGQANACLDQIKVEFSEAVSLDSTHVSELGNLFLFRLTDQGALGWRADFPPKSMSRSDSTALLVFERYKDHPTPVALDSIKIRGTADETPLLRDLNGNYPSPRQVGAKIEGVKPLEIQTVYIGDLNVDNPAIRKHLDEDPVAVYGIDPGSDLDSIAVKYPGTVGHIIKLDIPGKIFTAGVKPDPANVKVIVDDQYYTNLGAYVAKGKQTIPCTDAIFKGNCLENSMYLYVAWNMTTDDHRFVGSGAYISVLDFHWTMKVGAVESSEDSKKVREIVGVRRGAGVIK